MKNTEQEKIKNAIFEAYNEFKTRNELKKFILSELLKAVNEDRWITLKPHGKDADDYKRLKIKDGETVEDAMHRQGYYNKRQAKDEKEQKEKQKDTQQTLTDETHDILTKNLDNIDTLGLEELIDKAKKLAKKDIPSYLRIRLQEKIFKIQDAINNKKNQKKYKKVTKIAGVVQGKPMTHKEANSGKVNPNYGKNTSQLSYSQNCQSCVVCYQMRKNGFNVKTKGMPINKNGKVIPKGKMYELAVHPEHAWIDPKTKTYPVKNICNATTPKEAYKWLDNNVKDGIYSFRLIWKHENSGHIVVAYKTNGILTVYDPQNNREYNSESSITTKYFDDCKLKTPKESSKPFLYRTDNLDINPEYADEIMEKY